MRKLLLTTLCFYMVACSSTSEVSKDGDAVSESSVGIDESSVQPSEYDQDGEDISTSAPVAVSLYTALNEAIKIQNDGAIQKASTDILTQNPKDIRALNALAIFYYKKGRFEAAQFLLMKAIAANNSSSELYSNLGLVHLAKNDRREAVKSFRKALELNPQDAVAAANVGSIYVAEKDFNKAALALEVSIQKGMRDSKVMNNYAVALTATGRAKEAGEIYEKILKENPSHREAMLNYSILLIGTLQKNKEGLDLLDRLKFVGAPPDSKDTIKSLEIKAKAGLK